MRETYLLTVRRRQLPKLILARQNLDILRVVQLSIISCRAEVKLSSLDHVRVQVGGHKRRDCRGGEEGFETHLA